MLASSYDAPDFLTVATHAFCRSGPKGLGQELKELRETLVRLPSVIRQIVRCRIFVLQLPVTFINSVGSNSCGSCRLRLVSSPHDHQCMASVVPSVVLQHSVHRRPSQDGITHPRKQGCCDRPRCRIYPPGDTRPVLQCLGVPGSQHHYALFRCPTACATRCRPPSTKAQDVVRTCSDPFGKSMGIVPPYFCDVYGCHIVRPSPSLGISGDRF